MISDEKKKERHEKKNSIMSKESQTMKNRIEWSNLKNEHEKYLSTFNNPFDLRGLSLTWWFASALYMGRLFASTLYSPGITLNLQ